MNKSAVALPLSPEESYLASKMLGKSLFSALQLAREKDLQKRKTYPEGDPSDVLKIPIPQELMPQHKIARYQEAVNSVIESPEGEMTTSYTPGYSLTTGENRNRLKLLGALAGGGFAGLPGAAAGAAAGALMESGPGRKGVRHSKVIEHLDGSREHVFEPEESGGVGGHIKRNIGSYLGIPAGAMLGTLPKSVVGKLLAAGGGALAGGLVGGDIDKAIERSDRETMMNDRKNREDMLTDARFRNMMLSDKNAEENVGMIGRAVNTLSRHPARMLIGGQEGFREAKKDYYMQQKAQIQQELMQAQKDYIDLLSRIKTASDLEAATPCIDAFCNGIAHAALFDKTARHNLHDVDISDDSVSRSLGAIGQKLMAASPINTALDAASTGLLGSAAGSAYLTYMLKKEMRENPDKYMEEKMPTRVELQPYV